jgi:hypothetical protein
MSDPLLVAAPISQFRMFPRMPFHVGTIDCELAERLTFVAR